MDETEVSQYFDSATEVYSRDRALEEVESWPIVDEFLGEQCDAGDRILEIGCGDGLLLEYVLEHTDVDEACGVDISAEMLPDEDADVAAQYRRASATDLPLPFEPESFDFVVMGDVLHHLVGDTRAHSKRKAQAALVEATNLLKPGGHLIVKDIYYRSPVGPDPLTSYVIFYGLKYANGLASTIDEQAADGLLVSFYTRDELVDLLHQAGTRVLKQSVEVIPGTSIPRRVLVGESACIRLYARKRPRTRDRSVPGAGSAFEEARPTTES